MLQDSSDDVVAEVIKLILQLYRRDRLDDLESKRPWSLCFAANGNVAREV